MHSSVGDLDHLREAIAFLVCPATKLPLQLVSLAEAERQTAGTLVSRAETLDARGRPSRPAGCTPWVLLREDLSCAYPVIDGIPILLGPEALTPADRRPAIDLTEARYAEAYEEMGFYNEVAGQEARDLTRSESYKIIAPALDASPHERESFPDPKQRWLDAVYDCSAQWDAYRHLTPIQGRRVLQLGGKGAHAVKFLLAGASEAWSVTPMLGEARFGRALAEEVGVRDRLWCVVGIAEELPIRSMTMDAVYSGGCLHHMQTEVALPEAARVLRPGGKFAAVDPWRAPLYAIGTKVFGKREAGAYCRPLTKTRIRPARDAFVEADVVQHGTIFRYPLLALSKLGMNSSLSMAWHVGKVDDAISSVVPGLRGWGSSVALLGRK